MKPVISANILPGQAALRASSTWPRYSTMAASTGVGLFQCVWPQLGQRRRSLGPPSSISAIHSSGVAQAWQNLGWGMGWLLFFLVSFRGTAGAPRGAPGCWHQAGKTPVDR